MTGLKKETQGKKKKKKREASGHILTTSSAPQALAAAVGLIDNAVRARLILSFVAGVNMSNPMWPFQQAGLKDVTWYAATLVKWLSR